MDSIRFWLYTDDCHGQEDTLLIQTETAADGAYSFTDLYTSRPGATEQLCYVVKMDGRHGSLGACWSPSTPLSLGFSLHPDPPDPDSAHFAFPERPDLYGPFVFCDPSGVSK